MEMQSVLLDTSHPIMFLVLNVSPINHDVQLVTCEASTAAKTSRNRATEKTTQERRQRNVGIVCAMDARLSFSILVT